MMPRLNWVFSAVTTCASAVISAANLVLLAKRWLQLAVLSSTISTFGAPGVIEVFWL